LVHGFAGEGVFGVVSIGGFGRDAFGQLGSVAVEDVDLFVRSERERVVAMSLPPSNFFRKWSSFVS
jgi:hypothetical protein